jgi:hypothetical protein
VLFEFVLVRENTLGYKFLDFSLPIVVPIFVSMNIGP